MHSTNSTISVVRGKLQTKLGVSSLVLPSSLRTVGDALTFISRKYRVPLDDMLLSVNNYRILSNERLLSDVSSEDLYLSPNSRLKLSDSLGNSIPRAGSEQDTSCNRRAVTFIKGANSEIKDQNKYVVGATLPDYPGGPGGRVTCNDFFSTYSSQLSPSDLKSLLDTVGCSGSGLDCEFEGTVNFNSSDFGDNCQGPVEGPNALLYRVLCNITFDCTKTGWDPAYKAECCSQIGGGDSRCDPNWCIDDPSAECLDVFMSSCTGSSTCGRHKFLTFDSALTGNMACNSYFMATQDIYLENGKSATPSNVSPNTILKEQGIMQEVNRYCSGAGEGAASGECSCYRGYINCQGAQAMSGQCLMHVPDPSTGGVGRRVDVYCEKDVVPPQYSSYTVDGGKTWLPGPCNGLPSYASPTVNPDSGNPYVGGGGVGGFPLHCWLPECQTSGESCGFKNLTDFLKPCPDICFQYSSGANINIINIGTESQSQEVDVTNQTCNFAGTERNAMASPFAVAENCLYMSIEMAVNTKGTISMQLYNLSQDTLAPFTSISYAAFSSLDPMVSFLPGDQTGTIENLSSKTVHLVVDTSGQAPYTVFNGFIDFRDASGANGQYYAPLQVAVLGPDSPQGGNPNPQDGTLFPCDPNFFSTIGPSVNNSLAPSSLRADNKSRDNQAANSNNSLWIGVVFTIIVGIALLYVLLG